MKRLLAVWVMVLSSAPAQNPPDLYERRAACMDICIRERQDPDLQREEVMALERETARAVQLKDPAFFNRVYSDDFNGVSSRGELVDKAKLIAAVQTPDVRYDAVTPSRLKVRLYRDTAVATCLWSMRSVMKGQAVNSQMLVTHIYVYGPAGFRAVSSQTTMLPPYTSQPL